MVSIFGFAKTSTKFEFRKKRRIFCAVGGRREGEEAFKPIAHWIGRASLRGEGKRKGIPLPSPSLLNERWSKKIRASVAPKKEEARKSKESDPTPPNP